MLSCISSINKLSVALVDLYETGSRREKLLDQVERIQSYLDKEKDVKTFLSNFGLERKYKKEVIDLIIKALELDELFSNCLHILADKNMSPRIPLFLSTLRSNLLRALNIKNIYVYSAFPIVPEQKKRLEDLWRKRINKSCNFHYILDSSLRLGIKVQIDMYIEEYSLTSNLTDLKLKLNSLFD